MKPARSGKVEISPEWQFVLASARLVHTDVDRILTQKLITDRRVDWSRVEKIALAHDVAPLMHRALKSLGVADKIDSGTRATLANAYYGNAVRNQLLFGELAAVLSALQKTGTAVIVLKGAALADAIYLNRALRPMSDVDLLVRKADVTIAESILAGMGYKLHEWQQDSKDWFWRADYHFSFSRDLNATMRSCMEVHWHVESQAESSHVDIDGFWDRAVRAEIAGVPAFVLCAEDLLLYLCLHACKHELTGGLRAFCDISEVVRHNGYLIDWDQLQARAGEWNIEPFVYAALHVAHALLDAPIPQQMRDRIARSMDAELLEIATAAVLQDRLEAALFPDFLELQQGRTAGRLAIVKRLFSEPVIVDRYGVVPGSGKFYWYYPIRFKDLLLRYTPEFLRFARRGSDVHAQALNKALLAKWLEPVTKPHRGSPNRPAR